MLQSGVRIDYMRTMSDLALTVLCLADPDQNRNARRRAHDNAGAAWTGLNHLSRTGSGGPGAPFVDPPVPAWTPPNSSQGYTIKGYLV
jgi:hypothetical protein